MTKAPSARSLTRNKQDSTIKERNGGPGEPRAVVEKGALGPNYQGICATALIPKLTRHCHAYLYDFLDDKEKDGLTLWATSTYRRLDYMAPACCPKLVKLV